MGVPLDCNLRVFRESDEASYTSSVVLTSRSCPAAREDGRPPCGCAAADSRSKSLNRFAHHAQFRLTAARLESKERYLTNSELRFLHKISARFSGNVLRECDSMLAACCGSIGFSRMY